MDSLATTLLFAVILLGQVRLFCGVILRKCVNIHTTLSDIVILPPWVILLTYIILRVRVFSSTDDGWSFSFEIARRWISLESTSPVTQQAHDTITSLVRENNVTMSFWHINDCYCVVCPLGRSHTANNWYFTHLPPTFFIMLMEAM